MKSTKIFSLFLLILCLGFTSCKKDDSISDGNQQILIPDSFSEYFGNEISRDFLGTVIDKNNLPIEGVTITIGNETALTDGNGVFIIRDADVNQRFGYVKAEKAGYIHGSRSIVPSEGTNKVNIMLLEANVIATINSGNSETISLTNGSSVSFDGNFIKEDGSAYSGSVDVIMHHLDPADDNMTQQMPGMLYAQNTDGAERMLQTLGMLAVELRGNSGEELNLAEGSTSEIRMPVDASLMSIAPATIPLWYFDEVNGYWKEEGQATLQGNMYVGTVSHFSFWNCDIPAEAISLCITVIDEEGNELSDMNVKITSATFGTTNGNTNEKGEVCGYVPSNESLSVNIYLNNNCNNTSLYTENIGPFSTDSNITIVIPNNSEIIQETVIGTFNTCDGDPVSDGYVKLAYSGKNNIGYVTDGEFEVNLIRCADNTTFSIKGIDYNNLQFSPEINYTFTSPITNIGVISACNSIEEFIQFTINGSDDYIAIDDILCVFYINWDGRHTLYIRDNETNGNACIEITVTLDQDSYLGTYNYGNINNPGFIPLGECIGSNGDSSNSPMTLNLTSFGEVGEYIDINFSGSLIRIESDGDGSIEDSIVGVAHVLRDE
ncbi:carboxypeptidase regulatory-like domain-containing protein [Winogradskyella litoriviva]|uniref:Carboxypeptidase regulatory-like domain-containing protein n=1 Tax=Winogradskyella litoriviva TaxID=1220182 RepID=A0ABX2E6H5_9FLAO|nr:carboxypeptidase-like regulatory domain-containing protein [Winogradskyella litoriviva]NRD23306.1 carboxypeptidase regulatory-like domain-containing protein [Winogradskyella litoriviva]